MNLVTIHEKIVRYRTRKVSRSQAARFYLRKFYPHKMSQSAISRKYGISVQCVNEQADALGLVVHRA